MRGVFLALATSIAVVAPAAAQPALNGQWIVATDRWGNLEYSILNLARSGPRVSGDWDGDPVSGTIAGDRITLTVNGARNVRYAFTGRLAKGVLTGEADFPDSNDPARRARHSFTARRVPDRPAGGSRTHDFAPTVYANAFSPDRPPVLTIWPGDRVRTTTLDSGGMDAKGVTRALFGNPQTGPFFVAGAAPGDTIVIHIETLRLNRDWADSLDAIVGRALGRALVAQAGDLGKPVRWKLDRVGGFATPEGATGALRALRVPLRPMLGGLALASGPGAAPLSTGDTGRAGGNMDFPEVIEGNSVSLPVLQPGGLIYLGDGHALQGDGETSQFALETSLDVEFRVELIKGRSVSMPRIESPTELMVLGQAGSLDEALKFATTGMIQWLQQDYGLTLSEAAQVMGSSLRLSIPNLAGRNVGVAAKLDKRVLPARK
ncbi:acetamidase/formamidase family protein [Sphingomonas sp. HF-S3]|uniref:Acetamidase/formamidase family protein n=1 Tax=Sphingomonas rustica TaxID=3103142 RepID=A0ABV0B6K8_9SPHN